MKILSVLVALFLLMASTDVVIAASSCESDEVLPAGSDVEIATRPGHKLSNLQFRLAKPIFVRIEENAVDKVQDDRYELTEEILVHINLTGDHISQDGARFNASQPSLYLKHAKRLYERSTDNKPWSVAPVLPEGAVYKIEAKTEVKPESNDFWSIPKDTLITLELYIADKVQAKLLTRVAVAETVASSDLSELSVVDVIRAPEGRRVKLKVQGDRGGFSDLIPVVCFYDRYSDKKSWVPVSDTQIKAVSLGANSAEYSVVIPDIAKDDWYRLTSTPVTLRYLGYRADGSLATIGNMEFDVSSKSTSGAIAFGIFLLVLSTPVLATLRRPAGPLPLTCVIRGLSGRASVSNFQIWIWTILVITSLAYVWLVSGIFLEIPGQVLGFLGIAGGASVLAKGIASHKSGGSLPDSPASSVPLSFSDLFSDAAGFSLLRFQMLVFTLFALFYVAVGVATSHAFPEVPDSIVMLMGVSNLAYLGGKVADESVSTAKLAPDLIMDVQHSLGVPPTGQLDEETKSAVRDYQNTHGVKPADGLLSETLATRILDESEPLSGGAVAQPVLHNIIDEDAIFSADEIQRIQQLLGIPQTGAVDETTSNAVEAKRVQTGLVPGKGIDEEFVEVLIGGNG